MMDDPTSLPGCLSVVLVLTFGAILLLGLIGVCLWLFRHRADGYAAVTLGVAETVIGNERHHKVWRFTMTVNEFLVDRKIELQVGECPIPSWV